MSYFEKVGGEIFDFMATFWAHGNGFFDVKNYSQYRGFPKYFPTISGTKIVRNSARECQGIGQNFVKTILEKVKKTRSLFFNLLEERNAKSKSFRLFLYSKRFG